MPFTVSDFHDLIRLLEATPEWRVQLLRVLFPEALLDLPRAVEALAEAQRRTQAALDRLTERMERGFAEAAADRQRIWEVIRETNERMEKGFAEAAADRQRIWEAIRETNERMEKGFAEAAADRQRIWEAMGKGFAEAAADRQRIWEAIRETNERMERGFTEAAADRQRIKKDISDVQKDVRDLKGDAREQYYRNRATGIFGRRLQQGHDATSEVADQLRIPLQKGRISNREYDHVLASDLLWGGKLQETGESAVLVIEVSWRMESHDVARAEERAAMLRKVGLKALPVAAGQEWPDEVKILAREKKVVIVQDGSVDEASWQAALNAASPSSGGDHSW
jgi:uncharacterized protein YwgA